MKKYLLLIALLLNLYAYTQKLTGWYKNITWIPFTWLGDTTNGGKDFKGAMFLPIKIEGIDKQFKMQFDNGAPVSMVYGKTLSYFITAQLKKKINEEKKGWINSVQYATLQVPFSLGNYTNTTSGLVLYKNYGDELSKEDKKADDIVIGTIGADIFKGRILIIDYPARRIAIVDSLPKYLIDHSTFTESKLEPEGRMLIGGMVNGKEVHFLFDTGTMNALNTDTKRWKTITDYEAPTDSSTGIGWGQEQKHYGAKITATVFIGGRNMKGNIAYGMKNEGFSQFYDNLGVFGIVGNAMFYDDVIIMNYRDKMFGVLNRE